MFLKTIIVLTIQLEFLLDNKFVAPIYLAAIYGQAALGFLFFALNCFCVIFIREKCHIFGILRPMSGMWDVWYVGPHVLLKSVN